MPDSARDESNGSHSQASAPPATPLPDLTDHIVNAKPSFLIAKFRSLPSDYLTAPLGSFLYDRAPGPRRDLWAAPTGLYFLYGTLRDTSILASVLGFESPPTALRPAKIVG